ncbi:hypothetical protein GYH30_006521 [Glycine max]|nr:hypothetical protein GYH30_006521 [Glycine max]
MVVVVIAVVLPCWTVELLMSWWLLESPHSSWCSKLSSFKASSFKLGIYCRTTVLSCCYVRLLMLRCWAAGLLTSWCFLSILAIELIKGE